MSKHQPIPEPTPVRSVVTVAIFLAGFIAAVVGYLQVQPTPRAGLPSAAPGFLATVEPAAAQAVVQDMIKQGMTLEQIRNANPTKGYRKQYGSDTGPWTTDMFVAAVYKSLTAKP